MIEEKPKRKNDEEAYIQEWMNGEQNARRYLAAWFMLVTVFFFLLVNPFQYFGSLNSGFLLFYLVLISLPAIGGIILLVLSSNDDWTRKQIEKSIEKPDKLIKFSGLIFIAFALLQFFTGGGEQKLLIAPCLVAVGIYWFWRNRKYQNYLALVGEEKAK